MVGVLLLIDGLFLLANVANYIAYKGGISAEFAYWRWNGSLDGSFVETFGFIQLVASAILCVVVWRHRARAVVFAGWALLFAVLACDEFFRMHERGSEVLLGMFALPAVAGLRPIDLGELIVWTVVGVIPLTIVVVTHVASSRAARRDSWSLVWLVALLATFGIGVDMLGVVVGPLVPQIGYTLLKLLETAGELVVITLIAAQMLRIRIRLDTDQELAR